jgi:hypothetical protein
MFWCAGGAAGGAVAASGAGGGAVWLVKVVFVKFKKLRHSLPASLFFVF